MSSGIRSIRVATQARDPVLREELHVPRIVSVILAIALVGALLIPPQAFAGVRSWTLSRTPASVPAGSGSVQVTATNTGDDSSSNAVGCVVISVPNAGFSVSGVSIDALSDSTNVWSAAYSVGASETVVTLRSSSKDGGNNRLSQDEWVQATVSFTTTGADGTYSWVGNAFNKDDCTDDFFMPRVLSVTTNGTAPNSSPAAVADSYRVAQGSALSDVAPGVLANDLDADGDPLQAVPDAGPASGASLTLNVDGSFMYTPGPSFVGADSFTYRASDGSLQSAPTTVSITVSGAPIAVDDPLYVTTRDTTLNVVAPGVLANDTDPELDPLTASVVAATSNGTLILNADGSFTYVPDVGFVGTDSFTYAASDGVGSSNTATATIAVLLPNLAPLGVADAYAATEDETLTVAAPGLLANDTDLNGDSLTAILVDPPSKGSLTLNANGSFSYVPDIDVSGVDSFTYRASDGSAFSPVTPVSLSIAAVNDPPAASPDNFAATEDTPLSQAAPGVLANDVDPDGNPMTAVLVSPPALGTLALDPAGSFSYVPATNAHGPVTFRYRATDGTASSVVTTVTIAIAPVNDAPFAVGDSALASHNSGVDIPVMANDSDIDGDALTIASLTQPSEGSVAIIGRAIRFSPPGDFIGATSFSYTISDGSLTDTASVTVVVGAPPPSPEPEPSFVPQPTLAPGADPTLGAVPPPPPSEPPTDPDGTPAPSPRITTTAPDREPPAAAPVPQEGVLAILTVAQLTASTVPGTQSGFGGFGGAFGDMSGGLTWAVPAAALGLPGLLFIAAVGSQVAGAAVWVPAVRRSLAGVGLRRRRVSQANG